MEMSLLPCINRVSEAKIIIMLTYSYSGNCPGLKRIVGLFIQKKIGVNGQER